MSEISLSTQHKKVILPPEKVALANASIPGGIALSNGSMAFDYNTSVARTINRLGMPLPMPICYYYTFPNLDGYKPFHAQYATAAFISQFRSCFVLNDMGTGKTLATAWSLDYMISEGEIRKCLIVSPLSTLQKVWGDTFMIHFPHRTYAILYGDYRKRARELNRDVDFYIVNPEGLGVVYQELMHRPDIDHVVVDEVAEYREENTDKYKILASFIGPGRTITGLTGTPMPKAPTDAWSQIRLVNPKNVTQYFGQFRRDTMFKESQYKWIAKPNAQEIVFKAMQPAIRFTRDQCFDLPEIIYTDLEVQLSKEQEKAYKEMAKVLHTEFAAGAITAANQGVKLFKLLQIVGGVVYDDFGQPVHIPCKDRLNVARDIIRQAGTKVIVFVPFKEMLATVADYIGKEFSYGIIQGDVPTRARDLIFHNFQTADDPRVIIAHPRTMSHGLTLTAASTIIWYAPYPNNNVVDQANHRIRRPGQKNNQLVVYLQGSAVERKIIRNLRMQQDAQDILLDMFINQEPLYVT